MVFLRIGVKEKIIYDGYLPSTPCENCGHDEQNNVLIWCKRFIFSFFTLFAWDRRANVTCKNCNRSLNYEKTSGAIKYKLEALLAQNTLISKNIVGFLIVGFIGFNIISSTILGIANTIGGSKTRISGHWISVKQDQQNLLLNIYSNNTFSILQQDTMYSCGKWNIKNDSIVFNYENGKKLTSSITFPMYNEVVLKVDLIPKYSFINMETYYSFVKQDSDDNNFEPLKPEYNLWRKKANEMETDSQIKARIDNYLTYIQFRFENAVKHKINNIDSEPISPFKIAINGIAIKSGFTSWDNIFYSMVDAQKAHSYINSAFPDVMDFNEKNIFIRNINFFKSYKENLKKLP